MSFSETIKELRAKKNITQRDLAQQVGISYTQLNRYEKGVVRPRLPVITKLAEALGVDYKILNESILVEKSETQDSDNEYDELFENTMRSFNQLSYKQRKRFARYAFDNVVS